MAEAGERSYDPQLAREHSLLLDERLRGNGTYGPTSFAGQPWSHANRVNEYASLAPDEDAEPGQKPLQRWVSNIGRVVPSGVQLEPRGHGIHLPPSAAAAARGAHAPQFHAAADVNAHDQQAAKLPRLSGRFSGAGQAGQMPAQQAQAQQQQRKAPVLPPMQAHAAMVPGNPLKIRLKITNNHRPVSREGSMDKRTPPLAGATAAAAAQLLQSVRQLGAGSDPLLSPIPQAWADVVSSSPAGLAAGSGSVQRGAPEQVAPSRASSMPLPLQSASARASEEQHPQAAAAAVVAGQQGQEQQQQQQGQEQQQQGQPLPTQQHRQPSPPVQQQQRQASPPVQQHGEPPSHPAQLQQQHGQPSAPPAAAPGTKRAAAASRAPSPPAGEGPAAAVAGPPAKRQRGSVTAPGTGTVSPQYATPAVQPDGSAALSAATAADLPLHASSGSHSVVQAHSSNLGQAPAAGLLQQIKQGPALAQGRQRSATPPAVQAAQQQAAQQQQQPAVPAWVADALQGQNDSSRLGVVAALLPSLLDQAAGGELPHMKTVQSLQEEGKKLKKFAEKKTKDGKPTHVSSMFLCQSCVKFFTVAAIMESHPAKYPRESTSSMYSQTASLLDSCALNSGRAEGPTMITTAIALLAQRLAAVARLRAAYCLRSEGMKQVAAFRGALEKASGETYQRPSPTDSNTSTSISVPLDASGGPVKLQQAGGGSRGGSPPGVRPRTHAATGAARGGGKAPALLATVPEPALVGMPRAVLERQLLAAQHSQALLAALSSFSNSSEKLREFMGQAAAQSNVLGLKVAASALLLSADAGMGPAGSILSFAKDALDAIMKMQ